VHTHLYKYLTSPNSLSNVQVIHSKAGHHPCGPSFDNKIACFTVVSMMSYELNQSNTILLSPLYALDGPKQDKVASSGQVNDAVGCLAMVCSTIR
jgi:hypothetical protein